ncbi:MAG: MBL fold metallo-hydrolase [Spirochaetales bacterium]|nr:MBL fold metallo-hydrolase [Spirochaetales bacterium]
MKKTYITTMPDHIGAFLKASECFAKLGVNITRVSYNKAIDSHTLFIDADGDETQLAEADKMLTEIGYLHSAKSGQSIVLLEFMLKDIPGSVTDVLRVIHSYNLNISYISSQENGTDYQAFKMGLFVDDEQKLQKFLSEVGQLCQVRVIDYNHSEKVYDNSIFYQSFVSGLMQSIGIAESGRDNLLVNTNLIMQMLDEKGLSPYKTFESISRFADLLASCRGEAFNPRISRHRVTDNTEIILIEPPCGSNTAILRSGTQTLFIDSGYALYQNEMTALFRQLLPDYDTMHKAIYVTHADVDHCGLLPLFDEIIAGHGTAECLTLEAAGQHGYREQNAIHRPYINICKALTFYRPPNPDKIRTPWEAKPSQQKPLEQIGFYDFGEMHFEVYQGKGGHLPGETVLIDYAHHIAFTGDIYINMHGMTKEQAEYNQYAPVLMTSVDTDPSLCALERQAILERLGIGRWQIFGAHGMKKEYEMVMGNS